MSSNKRQKTEVGQGTQMLSAAALRRRLLERQASTTSTASVQDTGADSGRVENASSSVTAANGGDRKRKTAVRSPVQKDVSRTPEQVLLGGFGAATTEDDLYGGSEPLEEEPPKRKVVQLSSFKPTKSNFQKKVNGTAVLKFPDGERLVIIGNYGIRVKTGEATILGATLYPSETLHWVHAPHCHALPVLRCSERSIVEIHSHPSVSGLRRLERLSPTFGSLWNEATTEEGGQEQAWQILYTSADGPKRAILQELKAPAEWNKKIAGLVNGKRTNPPVLLVCGPKSSGKSTFSRILTNKLVTHQDSTRERMWSGVAILDIDPGQPEFSPPGVISLVQLDQPNLAPPFCHPLLEDARVKKSHVVASVTPASDVEHYKSCVMDLYKIYQSSCPQCPLIINTPGWIQGSGLVLLIDMIAEINPTEIIYMSEDGPEDTVEGLKSAGGNISFTTLPSQSSEYTSRTALHLRQMQAMSYFHVDPKAIIGTLKWDSRPLTSVPPVIVSYNADSEGILGVIFYGYQPEPEVLAEAIDGTILAIVEVTDKMAFRLPFNGDDIVLGNIEGLMKRNPEQIPYGHRAAPLNPQHSHCLGLALVRGIDRQRNTFALSTPLSVDKFRGKKLVLVSGKFDPPTWAYTEDHYNRTFRRGEEDIPDRDAFYDASKYQGEIPWVEKLHGSQKRAVGSKVWRVRRDLGRNNSAGGD